MKFYLPTSNYYCKSVSMLDSLSIIGQRLSWVPRNTPGLRVVNSSAFLICPSQHHQQATSKPPLATHQPHITGLN